MGNGWVTDVYRVGNVTNVTRTQMFEFNIFPLLFIHIVGQVGLYQEIWNIVCSLTHPFLIPIADAIEVYVYFYLS